MTYLAKIDGTYKTRVYIDLIFFKIVRGWQTESFGWSHTVSDPEVHLAFSPIKNIPIAISLDVTTGGADFGIQVLSQNFPIEHVSFPSGSKSLHWEPLKGVVIDATASFSSLS